MIIDTINNANLYSTISPRISEALKAIQSLNFAKISEGKYEIDKDNIFYMVQKYQTKAAEQAKPEGHKKYIDIQMVTSGEELIGWSPAKELSIAEDYNAENDALFYEKSEHISMIKLVPTIFAILYPDDAHMPGVMVSEPREVKKIVFKIKL